MTASPILIAAHPGHELLLFHWMERVRPTVFVLTDGSGGGGASRLPHSRACLATAGARAGAVFGPMPDHAWYAALAVGDAGPFEAAVEGVLGALSGPPPLIVADPAEGYNPMHDLTAAVAGAVRRRLAGRGPAPVLATYPLTRPAAGRLIEAAPLSPAARARKRAAIAAYGPLRGEAAALLAERPDSLSVEMLVEAPDLTAWPGPMVLPPDYERLGRLRVAEGRYASPLTYADHVAPVARRLERISAAEMA
jgi:hypothetical protein